MTINKRKPQLKWRRGALKGELSGTYLPSFLGKKKLTLLPQQEKEDFLLVQQQPSQ